MDRDLGSWEETFRHHRQLHTSCLSWTTSNRHATKRVFIFATHSNRTVAFSGHGGVKQCFPRCLMIGYRRGDVVFVVTGDLVRLPVARDRWKGVPGWGGPVLHVQVEGQLIDVAAKADARKWEAIRTELERFARAHANCV